MFAIVYLHGFASGPQSEKARLFRDFFAAKGVRFVAPDLNAPSFRLLTVTRMVEAAEQAAHGLRDVAVIGSSLGGYAAALWASQREAEGRPLHAGMLIAPAFDAYRLWRDRLTPEDMQAWRKSGELSLRKADGGWLYGPDYAALDYTFYHDAEVWAAMPLRLSMPLLVFHGEQDETVPAQRSIDFARDRPNVKLTLIPGAPHGLVDEAPLIAEKTWEFLTHAMSSQ